MDLNYFSILPESILQSIIQVLSFDSLLTLRATCLFWNQLISQDLIQKSSLILRIDDSKAFKAFKSGKWKPCLLGPWQTLIIFTINPDKKKNSSDCSFYSWGISFCFKKYFPSVQHLTLVEDGTGSCSVLDLVHIFANSMPKLRSVYIQEVNWSRKIIRTPTHNALKGFHTFKKSWHRGIKNFEKITDFRIGIFSQFSTKIYLRLLILAKPPLVTLDIDYSKNFGLPFDPILVNNMYKIVSNVILTCNDTLQRLRIKWDHRAEEDQDLMHNLQDSDPFVEFLTMISSNVEEFHGLRLKYLVLNFPSISFFSAMAFEVFVPFLKSQEATLERVHLSRCKWDLALQRFHGRFEHRMQDVIEYTIYMLDIHEIDQFAPHQRLQMIRNVRGIEFHSVCTEMFTLEAINARRRISRRNGRSRWAKHPAMMTFKFFNSGTNVLFQGINLKEIVQCFKNIQELELIDGSGEGYEWTDQQFNMIFLKLSRLKSLKLTNLGSITDAGITSLNQEEVRRMRDIVGVYFPLPEIKNVPIAQAKYLRYLELRDLSSKVSDISIYIAFQYIPSLEKIGFHGNHKITEFGHLVLLRRFRRNPLFAIYFQSTRRPIRPYMLDYP